MKTTKAIPALLLALALAFTMQATAQDDINTLLDQLANKAEAPSRSADELADAYSTALDYLIPLVAADKAEDRYAPQSTLMLIASHAGRPGAEAERAALCEAMIKRLGGKTPQASQVWIVRQLERIGGKESANVLARLLWVDDVELRDCARRALMVNPSEDATRALRRALRDAKDDTWKIGLMDALAERGDSDSERFLANAINADSPAAARAAAIALGKIATPSAARALMAARGEKKGALKKAITDAALDASVRMTKAGDKRTAYTICNALWGSDNSPAVRAAALGGLAAIAPERNVEKAKEALASGDYVLQAAAIQFARAANDAGLSAAVAKAIPGLSPVLQSQALGVLAVVGDAATQGAVIAALGSDESMVRLTAIEALGNVPGELTVDALLDTVAKGGEDEKAALAVFSKLPGQESAMVLRNRAKSAAAPKRVAAIKAAAARNAAKAAPSLMAYAGESDADVSKAALNALAVLGGDAQIGGLAELSAAGKSGASSALASVCRRAEDPAAAVSVVLAKMDGAGSAKAKAALVGALPVLAQDAGLKAVVKAAASSDAALSDAAIRALCDWPAYPAIGHLIKIAANEKTELKYNVLALRAASRLLQLKGVPKNETIGDAEAALKAARRAEETDQLKAVLAELKK